MSLGKYGDVELETRQMSVSARACVHSDSFADQSVTVPRRHGLGGRRHLGGVGTASFRDVCELGSNRHVAQHTLRDSRRPCGAWADAFVVSPAA
jgi:hypothetical protein